MKRILVTGATGNIGREVINYLSSLSPQLEIYATVRTIESAKKTFSDISGLRFLEFNFEVAGLYTKAIHQLDILFLLQTPHLSNGVINQIIILLNIKK
jgi:uncharacterized protein YbjT (DUF2867 family)